MYYDFYKLHTFKHELIKLQFWTYFDFSLNILRHAEAYNALMNKVIIVSSNGLLRCLFGIKKLP